MQPEIATWRSRADKAEIPLEDTMPDLDCDVPAGPPSPLEARRPGPGAGAAKAKIRDRVSRTCAVTSSPCVTSLPCAWPCPSSARTSISTRSARRMRPTTRLVSNQVKAVERRRRASSTTTSPS